MKQSSRGVDETETRAPEMLNIEGANQDQSRTAVIDMDDNRLVWNLEEENSRVIETGVALGFDFGDEEESIREELRRREIEDESRLRETSDR